MPQVNGAETGAATSRPSPGHPPEKLSIKAQINRALFELSTPIGRRCNIGIMMLILLGVLVSMLGSLDRLPSHWREGISHIELGITVVFAVEYLSRIYSARNRAGYAFSIFGIVDLLTILPLLLIGDTGFAIRLLRIFRMLKLFRYLRALRYFMAALKDVLEMMTVVLVTIVLVVLISGNLMHYLEPENITNAFEGCWWSIVTMTTVGYGDLVPTTVPGRVVASALMMLGMAMFAMFTATISVKIAHVVKSKHACRHCTAKIATEYRFCPHCGKTIQETQHDADSPEPTIPEN